MKTIFPFLRVYYSKGDNKKHQHNVLSVKKWTPTKKKRNEKNEFDVMEQRI